MQFCKRCERMYGREIVTPNMHMHTHLRDCILDFGPAHAIWLFSFERYNGILEALPNNNNRSIEVQLMKRFMENTEQLVLPEEHIFKSKRVVGTLSQGLRVPTCIPDLACDSTNMWLLDPKCHELPKFFQRGIFSDEKVAELKQLYAKLLNVPITSVSAPNAYRKYQQINVNGKLFGSSRSRSASSSIIMAVRHPSTEECAACVHFYAQHAVIVGEETCTFLLFYPAWFKPHQQNSLYGKPVSMWEPDCFELSNSYSLLEQFHLLTHAYFQILVMKQLC